MAVRTENRGLVTYAVEEAEGGDLALSITRALAAARGEDPTNLSVQLYDYVDPDALERLLDHAGRKDATWETTFVVEEHAVTVTGDGEIEVR